MLRKWIGRHLYQVSDFFWDAATWITHRDRWSWLRGRRRNYKPGDVRARTFAKGER